MLLPTTLGLQVPGGTGDPGILSLAAASFQLLPTLLGFPITLTASDEGLALPAALAGPELSPRQATLSYKGAMLDGLQESRSLYSAQLPSDAPGRQGVKPDQAPPGEGMLRIQRHKAPTSHPACACCHRVSCSVVRTLRMLIHPSCQASKAYAGVGRQVGCCAGPPASGDPSMLWQRSRSEPELAPPMPSAPSEGAGADSAVLWKRAEPEAPASLTFPRARDESRAPEGQESGRLVQAPAQRHSRRPSALLDNVAPAGPASSPRLPVRQHANGRGAQPSTGLGYSHGVGETSGAPPAIAPGESYSPNSRKLKAQCVMSS